MDKKFIREAFGEIDDFGFTSRNINISLRKQVWLEGHGKLCPYCDFKSGDNRKFSGCKKHKRIYRTWKHNRIKQYK